MINKNSIAQLLLSMTNDEKANINKIKKVFGRLDYKDEDNQTLLHILADNKYDEDKCFLAIKSLLWYGLNPNAVDDFDYNFIQTALYAGYSERFIINIIKEALKYKLNINHVDSDRDTIMHTAIYSDDYLGEVINIYLLLCDNGFDSTKLDHDGRNLLEAMIFQKQYRELQIQNFKDWFIFKTNGRFQNNSCNKSSNIVSNNTLVKREEVKTVVPTLILSEKEISELEKYGSVLNKKVYKTAPTIGREKELKNLMVTLAQDKKRPIIVGESGVGKTAIVEELVYRIQTGQVPSFLQGKIILEVNPADVVAGCEYVGQFEKNMTDLMKLCEKYKIIVFIDEIHTVYGIGSTKRKDNDMASMLKHYIDRTSLMVIGTTTEQEYNAYFSNDALKRRFEKITVKEPTEDILYQIIDKVISDYLVINNMRFENDNIKENIISIIITATNKKNRVYNDIVNNPDLAISLIDKAFALAKVDDSEFITSEHFIESFDYCDRIYGPIKEQAIVKLKGGENSVSKTPSNIYTLNLKR